MFITTEKQIRKIGFINQNTFSIFDFVDMNISFIHLN